MKQPVLLDKLIRAARRASVKTKREIAISRFRAGQLKAESGDIH